MEFVGTEGERLAGKSEVTDLKCGILSVSQMVDRGYRVVFESSGSSLVRADGSRINLVRKGGVWELPCSMVRGDGSSSNRQTVTAIALPVEVDDTRTELEARALREVQRPGPEEVAKHNLTHLPHADWCPVCVSPRVHATSCITEIARAMSLEMKTV